MGLIITKSKNEIKNIESGKFEVITQEILGGETFTKEINLTRSDYNIGKIFFYVPNSITLTANRRMTSYIEFTTELNEAIAASGTRTTYTIVGYQGLPYYFDNYWPKGYKYEDDSKLSDVLFFDNGQQTGLRGQLRIESCQIVGNKIELKFRNTHLTQSTNLTIKGRYNAYRI